MSSPAALKTFFKAERYAVVGASKDPAKFGNKVLKWYKARGLPVTPVHPKEPSIEDINTVSDISKLHSPMQTSLSFVTPPAVTLPTVQRALAEHNVVAVWLQPGAENAEFNEWLKGQDSSVKDKIISGGPCILVQGESLAREQGRL